MGMSPYISAKSLPFLKTPALAFFQYKGHTLSTPSMPIFPHSNGTKFVTSFTKRVKSLPTAGIPVNVPRTIDRSLFFTIGLNVQKCSAGKFCQGPQGGRLSASMNNISFQMPKLSILQAYFQSIAGVYTPDFPDNPGTMFDFVNNPPNNAPKNTQSMMGTRVTVLEFNSNVQIILQDTGIVGTENHPIHLHGFSFYVVGFGFGNYEADTARFNIIDPPLRNTFGVPVGGWAAIRFKADNPGVWFM
eukprot:c20208_g2_i1 orf=2-733(-)